MGLKRTLLTALAFYLLYDRQHRAETRIKAWQAELHHWLVEFNEGGDDFAEKVVDSQSRLIKEVERALKVSNG